VFLAAPSQKDWDGLTKALAPYLDLAGDVRFGTSQSRGEHAVELTEALAGVFAMKAAADWERELTALDVACVTVEPGPSEACIMEGEAALARLEDQVVALEHPAVGEYVRLKPLVRFSRSGGSARDAPLLGQDTDQVLAELGYSAESIADLRARGVIGS
jgi:crotonobetainyl-CoA:carnitine CoA-transferase CaiB-like acyl-CoA transferase